MTVYILFQYVASMFQSLIHIQEFPPNKSPLTDQHHWFNGHAGKWWRTGKPGVLQSMGSQRVGLDLVTEQQQGTRGSPAMAILPSFSTLSLSHMVPSQWPGDCLKWPVSGLFGLKCSQDGFWASEGFRSAIRWLHNGLSQVPHSAKNYPPFSRANLCKQLMWIP